MQDPSPENISGEKVQRHVFKHEINWGYVALAIPAMVVALYLVSSGKNQDSSERHG